MSYKRKNALRVENARRFHQVMGKPVTEVTDPITGRPIGKTRLLKDERTNSQNGRYAKIGVVSIGFAAMSSRHGKVFGGK